ncbi:putative phosphatase YwpJ [compost metagenome]
MKLFATDLDGTLLNLDSRIAPESAAAIHRAQQEGLHIAIATGRIYADVVEISQDGGVKTPVISSNGATIHDIDGNLLYHLPVERDTAISVMQWLDEQGYYYEASTDRGLYAPLNRNKEMLAEMDRLLGNQPGKYTEHMIRSIKKHYEKPHFHRVGSYLDIPKDASIYNIMAFSLYPEELNHGRDYFAGRKDVAMVVSSEHNFEMQHPDVSKGNALARLTASMGISMEDTAAIGDNYNDVSMLQMAGLGIAMGNAAPDIQEIAQAVTLKNFENGVAHAIHCVLEGTPISQPKLPLGE